MPDASLSGILFGRCCLAAVLALVLATTAVQAQSVSGEDDAPPNNTPREVAVTPDARDTQIADRLQSILSASDWFDILDVSVREGIVFLDGQTETEERRDWAQQLASRTQDVVAVVNRIEVHREISWDLTPTWREVERLVERTQWFAPLTVVSIFILFIFWLFSRGVTGLTRRLLNRRMTSPLLVDIAARAAALPVFLIGLYLVLQIAGLTRLAVTVLGGTGLVGIIVGLAFREIAENALASILLSVRNPFRTGDWIRIGDCQGIVQNLNMRTTILLTLDGNHIQIPNSVVFNSIITNFSTNPNRRAEFTVGIGYENSIVQAQDLIIATLRTHPAVLAEPEPVAIVEELGPSTVDIKVLFWFDGKSYSIFRVRSSVMRQVKAALQSSQITMPAPVHEVIFPQGVPLQSSNGTVGVTQAPQHTPAPDNRGEAASISSGEGDLKSEESDLQQQADASVLPEAQTNLLSSDNPLPDKS